VQELARAFSERGVATAIGELPASCNSHWRFTQEKIAINNGDFVFINTGAHVFSFKSEISLSFYAHSFKSEISVSFYAQL